MRDWSRAPTSKRPGGRVRSDGSHRDPSIDGFPGYKSNEPGQLERAGIDFDLFDPTAYDVPGSFGVLYTNRTFLTEHPSAAQDFMRAAMAGLADAISDPAAAARSPSI